MLTRQQILDASDMVSEVVAVPEWGGEVKVRSITGAERDGFEASLVVGTGRRAKTTLVNARAKLVALACVAPDGGQLFGPADVEALGRKSGAALDRVFEVAQRLGGLAPNAIEDAAKN